MESVTLKAFFHRNRECIGIYFANSTLLEKIIRKQVGVKWSQANRCWYIPLTETAFGLLAHDLKEKATVDHTLLKAYLEKKKRIQTTLPEIKQADQKQTATIIIKPAADNAALQLSNENLQALQDFIEMLKLKSYSASTIKTYRNEFIQLLQLLKTKPVDALTVADLKRYMVFAMEKNGISENTAHSRLNALKFYFEQVLGREKFFWDIPRPKKANQLPKVFSQDDIAAIINSVANKKHKVMLMLAYSGGLRVSEVVSLKTYAIDSKRMTIFISAAKGKKDRQVTLSPVLLVMLREYALEYKLNKKGYLFEGSTKNTAYSTRSLQEVLQAAKKKAGVFKPGSIHSLRHSFATHLIEKGTDVTMIQKLLGHNDIKTTLIYLHTSNKDLLKIISPLDDLALT
jgi:integrase/recombinase XerD